MNIELWKEKILEVVEDISDDELQKETWFGKSEKVSSPEDLYCNLLDDFMFEEFLVKANTLLSKSQLSLGETLVSKMIGFRDAIFSYSDPQEILENPKWKEIRLLAASFKNSFKN